MSSWLHDDVCVDPKGLLFGLEWVCKVEGVPKRAQPEKKPARAGLFWLILIRPISCVFGVKSCLFVNGGKNIQWTGSGPLTRLDEAHPRARSQKFLRAACSPASDLQPYCVVWRKYSAIYSRQGTK